MILATYFRFNRFFSLLNIDVLALLAFTPGLVYVAMGSALQGYAWLFVAGALVFIRLVVDAFFRRRPFFAPNLNNDGLIFACVASTAFMIPNLFLNRGDACESPRAWRLEQILAAADEADPGRSKVANWPGYPPFLEATENVNRFFAPSQISWRRAVADALARKQFSNDVDFFGFSIHDDSAGKHRPAARAVRWASGAADDRGYDFQMTEGNSDETSDVFSYPSSLNGVRAAQVVPNAPVAPNAYDEENEDLPDVEFAPFENEPKESAATGRIDRPSREDALSLSMGDSATFRWQPLSQEGLLLVLCVIFLQFGVIATLILIGRAHFGSLQTGVAAALLYLLLPYVNQFSARLDHIVPALLILLAVLLYRRPLLAGLALGAAGSLVFYPFMLFPLWIAYYWKKGLGRFLVGGSAAILTLAVVLLFIKSPDLSYADALESMFGNHSLFLRQADGIWEYLPRFYRIPIISFYGAFCFGYALLVPQKSLAALISCSGALMLGAQFWMGRQGGLYMAWYLPLIILTVLRPNLADRTAVSSVVDL